ncbi:MAG: 50S ribosomal protein L23 [Pseudomonadales bacterium]|nr:50S ribosomal protein L23 [Pseudomonadales bacterium]
MNQERIFQVLLAPHVSEKATVVADKQRQYVFKVKSDATKLEIGKAVEALFSVKVERVNTLNMAGKSKRFGSFMGSRSDWKKAYVTLKEGFDIAFAGAGE